MVCSITIDVAAKAKKDIMTVAPLVTILSPAQVMDFLMASKSGKPLIRSSLWRAKMNML
jgi:hypothetical protein